MFECAILPQESAMDGIVESVDSKRKMNDPDDDDCHRKSNPRFSFPPHSHNAARRRGGVIYTEDDDVVDDHEKDNQHRHDNNNNNRSSSSGVGGDGSIRLIHPRHAESRSKSILKVKSLEDSLRSCSDVDDHNNETLKRRCRQSSNFERLMIKLQKLRNISNRTPSCKALQVEKERKERNEALSATSHSREPSTLSEQEAYYQAQLQKQQEEPQGRQPNNDQDDQKCQDDEQQETQLVIIPIEEMYLPSEGLSRHVSFSTISIRSFDITVDDNPSVSSGPAIGLSWNFEELPTLDLEQYELEKQNGSMNSVGGTDAATTTSTARSVERPMDDLRYSLQERQRLLQELGLPPREVKSYLKRIEKSRQQRIRTMAQHQRHQHTSRSVHPKRRGGRHGNNRRTTKPEWNLVVLDLGKRRSEHQQQQQGMATTAPSQEQQHETCTSSVPTTPSQRHSFVPLPKWKPDICKTDEELQDALWDRAQRQDGRKDRKNGPFRSWRKSWLSPAASSSRITQQRCTN